MELLECAGWRQNSCDDGPGIRSVLFLQGCSKNCPGCHNQAISRKGGGVFRTVEEVLQDAQANCTNKKLTISGGEPLEQQEALVALLRSLKQAQFNVCLYTGWELKQVPKVVLGLVDYLKVGEFRIEEKSAFLQYVGTENQCLYRVQDYTLENIDLHLNA